MAIFTPQSSLPQRKPHKAWLTYNASINNRFSLTLARQKEERNTDKKQSRLWTKGRVKLGQKEEWT